MACGHVPLFSFASSFLALSQSSFSFSSFFFEVKVAMEQTDIPLKQLGRSSPQKMPLKTRMPSLALDRDLFQSSDSLRF